MEPLLNALERFFTSNLRQRLISALVLIPAVLICIHLGGWVYALALTLMMALGLREWLRMVDPQLPLRLKYLFHAALLAMMLCGFWQSAAFGAMLGLLLLLVLFLFAARYNQEKAGWIATGLPYLAGSGLALLYLRNLPEGAGLVFYLMATVWATDVGAYINGRWLGGPKLMPDVSPHKTWAGLIGGMAFAACSGYVLALCFGAQHPLTGGGLALVVAAVAQLGDLFESYIKRRSGVKDSGGLIPGHGGVLDRVDGLLFAAMFLCLFQVALGNDIQWW